MREIKCPKCNGNIKDLGQTVEMIDSKTYEIFEAKVLGCDGCGYEVCMRIDKEDDQ